MHIMHALAKDYFLHGLTVYPVTWTLRLEINMDSLEVISCHTWSNRELTNLQLADKTFFDFTQMYNVVLQL